MQIKKSINNNRKELVDTLYLIMLQGINQLLPIIVMPYLMVKLGAEGYGYVGFSLSVDSTSVPRSVLRWWLVTESL